MLEMRSIDLRSERLKLVGRIVLVAAAWAPLSVVASMVEALAGEDTDVSISMTLTITIAVSIILTGVNGLLLYRLRKQGDELQRLRQAKAELEGRLDELRRGKAS